MRKSKWVIAATVLLGFASLGVVKEVNAAEMYRLYNKNSDELTVAKQKQTAAHDALEKAQAEAK